MDIWYTVKNTDILSGLTRTRADVAKVGIASSEATSNQEVMSTVIASKIPAKSGASEHVRDHLFAFGCGVSFVFSLAEVRD